MARRVCDRTSRTAEATMLHVSWKILFFVCCFTLSSSESKSVCPHRCLCFKTTVRCMFLQLEKVPDVPEDTTILDLRFNKIKEITKRTFANLPHLNTLLMNNNQLTRIENDSFSGLPDLRYLYLYKNRIKTIESHSFRGLQKLEQLYIHFNKIDRLGPETFVGLESLERLFLHNNHLSRIPYGVFKQLGALRRLRLDSNALICDCQLMWLAEMLKEKKDATQVAATCEQPAYLHGKSVMSLSGDDFSCKMPKLTEEPHDVDVTFGGTAYFNCKADGDPKPDIVWLHNSNEILPEQDSRYNILHDGTLRIVEAQDLDEGVYECMAKNPAGEIKSRAAKMHYFEAKGKLTFTEHPVDHAASVGSTVILPCRAAGNPVPHISWTHNDVPVPNSQKHHLSSGTLLIKNVQRSDSGIYQCTATSNESQITISARLIVQAPPTFLERPRDQEAIEGNDVELVCLVEGFPPPRISWTKDGEPARTRGGPKQNGAILNIKRVQKVDEGIYTCHAENDAGVRTSNALLMVREKVSPVFTKIPEDQRIPLGSSIEVPCNAKGQPMPTMSWKKDGHNLSSDDSNHRISPHGVLYMFNVKKEDEGVYECIAQNDVGYASISVYLTVGDDPTTTGRFPGNRFIVSALDEAKIEVEKALNHTLEQLFGDSHTRTPGELLQIFRFPDGEARNAARSAEIYERALEIVWNKVQTGEKFNLTEFSYQSILSPSHLELLANLSGCLVHRQPPPCDDMCFHRQYRTLDGSCNNMNNPLWGSSLTPFIRLLPPIYENGFNMPIGWSKDHLYNGFPKPSARLLSSAIVSADTVSQDSEVSHMLMQWGQFLDHDIDFSMPSISHASFVHGVDCAVSCEYAPPCFPIEVPASDRRIRGHQCMEFVRSSTLCGSGMTSVFFNQVQPREQVNQLTSYIDASNVYGSNERLSRHLRNLTASRGLLRSGVLMRTGKPLLPFNDGQPIDCKRDLRDSSIDCFLAGDVRANEQLGLLSMHTLWMREHNRIANELFTYNSQWNDDKLYHEARKIVGAMMQHITYTHWLPKVLGPKGMESLGPYNGYEPNVNPTVANVFATAALRFGHTLINPELLRLNESFQPTREGHLPLRKAFFAPFRLLEEGGLDPLMRGLVFAPAKLKRPDELLNSDLTEHLFTPAHLVAQDLASLNIQRGRDHALPSYNEWRKLCNLTVARTFGDFSREITDGSLLRKLEKLYGHPDNVDLWVGGISEDPIYEAKVGPTFLCLLVDQFKRLRAGDRLWYENPGIFTPEQLTQIKLSSLGQVLCEDGDNITTITKDVFLVPGVQNPSFVKCSSLPKLELKVWTECCQGCDASTDSNEISRLHYRTKRSDSHIDKVTFNDQPQEFSNQADSALLKQALHQRENDFDITEQRIEGLEDLVGKLEQTVKRLSRKVRKLEVEYKLRNDGSCRDNLHKKHKSGEKWHKDECTVCECEDNQITCQVICLLPTSQNNK